MWAQLAMAGLKSVADNQANKQNIASNVITQKYSPWTGQRADFSAQGKNSTISNMIAGYGAGMLQDKLDAEQTAQAVAEKTAQDKSDGNYYEQLSKNPASVGVSPISGGATPKSAFASAAQAQASRAPATVAAPSVEPAGQNQFMGMLQSSNPWEQLSKRPLLPSELDMPAQSQEPKVDPTAANRAWAWNNLIPDNSPLKRGY